MWFLFGAVCGMALTLIGVGVVITAEENSANQPYTYYLRGGVMKAIEKRIELLEKEKELLEDILKLRNKFGEGYKSIDPQPVYPYPIYPCPAYPCPTITYYTDNTGNPLPEGPVTTSDETYIGDWQNDPQITLTN